MRKYLVNANAIMGRNNDVQQSSDATIVKVVAEVHNAEAEAPDASATNKKMKIDFKNR